MNKKPTPNMDALRALNGEKPIDEQTHSDVTVISEDDVEQRKPPTDKELKNVRDLAADLYKRKRAVAKLLKEVEEHNVAIGALEEKSIPDAMRAIGMESFSLSEGFRIDLENFAHGYVKKEDEPKFYDWLEKNNFGSIIKHVLTISFGKGDDKWAKKFMADLAKRKRPIPVDRKDGIHPITWKAFFKERFEAEKSGEVPERKRLPRDMVAIHEGTTAVLFDPVAEAEKSASRAAKAAKRKKSAEVEM